MLIIKGIDRNVFRELLHSTFDISAEETLMERIFISWEKGNESLPLRLESWIIGISVFLRGTILEKANFCFRVYDLNTDGFITKDEMFTLMKNCLIKQPQDEDPEESVKDLMEIVLRKFDLDKDGKVSFNINSSVFFFLFSKYLQFQIIFPDIISRLLDVCNFGAFIVRSIWSMFTIRGSNNFIFNCFSELKE